MVGVDYIQTTMLRRRFLQTLATVPAVHHVLSAGGTSDTDTGSVAQRSRILPKGIGPGSTIGIVAPASAAFSSEVRDFMELCSSWGIKTKLGRNISRRSGYLSASDEHRAAEFMECIEDPSIDAVVCARGGYGVMRILPLLDFSAIRQASKVIMGFSDITALLVAVNQMSGLVTFHGPVASSSFDSFTIQSLKSVVLRTQPTQAFQDQRLTTIQPGIAQGRLTGGNLAMVVSTLGTRYEIDTRDAILFLEEINEEPYRIDRMLTQLWLAGKLQTCKGIAFGNFRNCESKGISITGPSFTLEQVFHERIAPLGIPAVYGLPFGHVKSKLTLPLGIRAELDATKKQLTLLEPATGERSSKR